MAKNTFNLADSTDTLNCLQTLRNNLLFFPEAEIYGPNGNAKYPVVSATFNNGKGSGAQKMIASEFAGLTKMLRRKLDTNFEEVEQTGEYRTAAQIAEDTLCLVAIDPDTGKPIEDEDAEPTHVQFRVREGKGAKPARIPLSEVDDVIGYMETRVIKVNEVLATMEEPESDDGDGSDE